MGRCRVVQPEIVRLPISDGDWIDVKKDLTYGERTRATTAVIGEVRADGWIKRQEDMTATLAQIVAYLVDWSLVDMQDRRIPIVTDQQKLAALRSLDDASVDEIGNAIERHAITRAQELAEAKNQMAGTPASVAT